MERDQISSTQTGGDWGFCLNVSGDKYKGKRVIEPKVLLACQPTNTNQYKDSTSGNENKVSVQQRNEAEQSRFCRSDGKQEGNLNYFQKELFKFEMELHLKMQRNEQDHLVCHDIIEPSEWEGTPKGHLVQLPFNKQGHPQLHPALRAPSSLTPGIPMLHHPTLQLSLLHGCFSPADHESFLSLLQSIVYHRRQ